MIKKFCSFPVTVRKAYTTTSGKKRIEAIASDEAIDYYMERFALEALGDMVKASKTRDELKPDEGFVKLLETHWDTFSIGHVVDGEIVTHPETGVNQYRTVLEMKENYPQANELFDDVVAGRTDKQLSVGGYIENWEEDYEYETVLYHSENDAAEEDIEIEVGVIKRFVLEHIAVTPPDGAANPRTGFEGVSSKNLGYKNGYVYRSLNDEEYQKKMKKPPVKTTPQTEEDEKLTLKDIVSTIRDTVGTILKEFREGEDSMKTKLERAMKLRDELKELVGDEEFTEEVIKELGVSFVALESDSESDPDETPEPLTEERVKEMVSESVEEVRKSIPEIPAIPEDNSEEVAALKAKLEEIETSFKTQLEELVAKCVTLEEDVSTVATASGVSKGTPGVPPEGEEEDEEDEEEDSENDTTALPGWTDNTWE